MATIRGSYELIDTLTGESRSIVGTAIDPAQAEAVLAAIEGLAEITPVTPEDVGGTVPEGQWTATDPAGRPIVVKLWREVDIAETAVGQALAALYGPQEG